MLEKIKDNYSLLLKWSEKITKTDMAYLVRGGFWINLNYITTSLLGLALSLLFANLISKELYGNYKYVLSIIGLIGATCLSGMNTSVTRLVSKGYEGILKRSVITQIKWSIIPFTISLGASFYFYINNNYPISVSLLIAGFLMPLTNSANTFFSFLTGKKDFKKYFIFNLSISFGYTLSVIIAIFFFKNLVSLVFFNYISVTILNILFYFITLKIYKPNNIQSEEGISEGKHLSLMNILSTTATQIDSILVFHYLGAAQLAIYSFAILVPEKIRSFFKFVPTIALPKMSNIPKNEIYKATIKKVKIFFLVCLIITIAYIIIAPFFYRLFLPQYKDSIIYSQFFSITLLATIYLLPTSALLSQMNKKVLYKFSSLSSLFQILTTFLLIYFYNLNGAVLAKLLSYAFNLLYSFFIFYRNYGKQDKT